MGTVRIGLTAVGSAPVGVPKRPRQGIESGFRQPELPLQVTAIVFRTAKARSLNAGVGRRVRRQAPAMTASPECPMQWLCHRSSKASRAAVIALSRPDLTLSWRSGKCGIAASALPGNGKRPPKAGIDRGADRASQRADSGRSLSLPSSDIRVGAFHIEGFLICRVHRCRPAVSTQLTFALAPIAKAILSSAKDDSLRRCGPRQNASWGNRGTAKPRLARKRWISSRGPNARREQRRGEHGDAASRQAGISHLWRG